MAGRGQPDGAAAGAAGLRRRDGRVLRPGQPGRAADLAQGRAERGVPHRGPQAAVGPAPAQPQNRRGLGAQGRMGAVPLVPRGARRGEVLPGDHGPGRALARRLRRRPGTGPGARQRPGSGHRPGGCGVRGLVGRGPAARPRPDRAGTPADATPAAEAGPGTARLATPQAGDARDRPAARPRDRPAQGLGRESQHRYRAPVRRDHGRGSADPEHDPVRQGHQGEPGAERPRQGRAQPGHPGLWVGPAGAPPGGQGARPGGQDQPCVHEPAVLGVRAGGPEVAREPSRLPVHRLRVRLPR